MMLMWWFISIVVVGVVLTATVRNARRYDIERMGWRSEEWLNADRASVLRAIDDLDIFQVTLKRRKKDVSGYRVLGSRHFWHVSILTRSSHAGNRYEGYGEHAVDALYQALNERLEAHRGGGIVTWEDLRLFEESIASPSGTFEDLSNAPVPGLRLPSEEPKLTNEERRARGLTHTQDGLVMRKS